MQQQALRNPTELQQYIEFSNSFYQDLLGYKPEKTSLQEIPESRWNEFTAQKGLNQNSPGIYLPRNQTAIIQEGNLLSLFHEYFGHGLFCEQTLSGRRLVDLEKKLLEEEKQEFQERQFTLKDIQKFRQQNQTFLELDEFRKQNLAQYELFAIWTEHLLSKECELNGEFQMKYDSLPKEERKTVDSVINFSEQYGNLATFYKFRLKKVQDNKRLLKLSKDIFGKYFDRTKLMIHFGSGKPFSDIDLFIASNDIRSIYEFWLDVNAYTLTDINKGIQLLNPMITNPIMAGRLIAGDEKYLKELKQEIFSQPITEEAINFNLQQYESEKMRAKDKLLGQYLQNKNWISAKTYLTNALALKNGDKILTFDGLVNYAKKIFSNSEKFIELRGGIK